MRDALTSSLVERRCGCKRCIADLLSDRPGHQPSNDVACDMPRIPPSALHNATNSTIDLGLRGYFRCDRANCCTIKKNRWPSRTFQQNPHMFCSELISKSGKTFRPTQTDRADCAPKCSEIGSLARGGLRIGFCNCCNVVSEPGTTSAASNAAPDDNSPI